MNFLRKLRKGNTGSFSYLAYGVGEIILVVIGILIAVSINNWNEDRQNRNELQNIYTIVKQDLENDLVEIDEVLDFYETRKPLFQKVLEDSVTRIDYIYNPTYYFLILGYPEISFDKRGYSLLSEFRSNSDHIQDTLVTDIIDFYTDRLLEIDIDDETRAKDFNDNFFYWKNNFDWWSSYIMRKDVTGFLDYALNDPDYKNRVANAYFLAYDVFIPELEIFNTKANEIIDVIEGRVNN